MIVMGTKGRGALADMLMGSVATKVVARSPIPVMTIN
jgi:nucleotide-binding universal stress UspA family protein